MDKITTSAPGKLLFMGEHAVVYGNPCFILSLDQRIKVTLEKSSTDECVDQKFAARAVSLFRQTNKINQPLKLTIQSDFSANVGLGSSSAITAATVYGLHKLFFNKEPDKKELFDFCYSVIQEVQGIGSGSDLAAAIYGGVLYFEKIGKTIEPIKTEFPALIVGYSGIKADTVSMINLVKEKMITHKEGIEEIFRNITNLVEEAKKAILEKDWQRTGTLMNFNQDYLEDLGVSTEKLNDMIISARNAGAYGAKLSGAGGGDCMIALASAEKRPEVEKAIEIAGGLIINAKIADEGVKCE